MAPEEAAVALAGVWVIAPVSGAVLAGDAAWAAERAMAEPGNLPLGKGKAPSPKSFEDTDEGGFFRILCPNFLSII